MSIIKKPTRWAKFMRAMLIFLMAFFIMAVVTVSFVVTFLYTYAGAG